MQTIATPAVYSADEHALVRLLSAQSSRQAIAIQAQLQKMFGDAIWLQQPPSLHITLMEIICDTEYSHKARRQYFDEWYSAHNDTVQNILGTIEPFDLSFTELLVSQHAIILKAPNSALLNGIRKALLEHIDLPTGTKIPPDITHSSLARFQKPISLEAAQRMAAQIPVNITERVTEFALVRDLGPPLFNGSPLQTYPLKRL